MAEGKYANLQIGELFGLTHSSVSRRVTIIRKKMALEQNFHRRAKAIKSQIKPWPHFDDTVRMPDENPSIGIILCKTKNQTIVEYALREYNKPIGVAQYKIVKTLPDEMKNLLSTPEQITKTLSEI